MGLSDFPNLHKIGLKPHFSAKIVYAKNAFSTLLADYGKSAFSAPSADYGFCAAVFVM